MMQQDVIVTIYVFPSLYFNSSSFPQNNIFLFFCFAALIYLQICRLFLFEFSFWVFDFSFWLRVKTQCFFPGLDIKNKIIRAEIINFAANIYLFKKNQFFYNLGLLFLLKKRRTKRIMISIKYTLCDTYLFI